MTMRTIMLFFSCNRSTAAPYLAPSTQGSFQSKVGKALPGPKSLVLSISLPSWPCNPQIRSRGGQWQPGTPRVLLRAPKGPGGSGEGLNPIAGKLCRNPRSCKHPKDSHHCFCPLSCPSAFKVTQPSPLKMWKKGGKWGLGG